MNVIPLFAVVGKAASDQAEILYVWGKARPEAKVIIVFLMFFSIMAWSVMIFKAIQMRRAKKLNLFFTTEFKSQKTVLAHPASRRSAGNRIKVFFHITLPAWHAGGRV